MKKILLFLVCAVCLYFCYDKFGRKTMYPKVIGKAIVQLDSTEKSQKVYFAIVNNHRYAVDHVLSKHGMWETPEENSSVTAFMVKKDTLTHFMGGSVDALAIDKAYQNQIPMIAEALGMLVLVVLLHRYQEEDESLTYHKKAAKKN